MMADPMRCMNMEEIATFHTVLCGQRSVYGHCDLDKKCPFTHCLSWHRRNPMKFPYRPNLCPNVIFCTQNGKMRVKSHCHRGRMCMFAHTKEEQMYHPLVYKTQLCRNWPGCTKYYCPFAHGMEELRNPDTIKFAPFEGPEKIEPPVLAMLGDCKAPSDIDCINKLPFETRNTPNGCTSRLSYQDVQLFDNRTKTLVSTGKKIGANGRCPPPPPPPFTTEPTPPAPSVFQGVDGNLYLQITPKLQEQLLSQDTGVYQCQEDLLDDLLDVRDCTGMLEDREWRKPSENSVFSAVTASTSPGVDMSRAMSDMELATSTSSADLSNQGTFDYIRTPSTSQLESFSKFSNFSNPSTPENLNPTETPQCPDFPSWNMDDNESYNNLCRDLLAAAAIKPMNIKMQGTPCAAESENSPTHQVRSLLGGFFDFLNESTP